MTRKHNNYCLDPCEVDDITIILVLAAVTPSLGLAFRPQGAPHLGLPPKTRANDKASHDQGTYMHVHVGGIHYFTTMKEAQRLRIAIRLLTGYRLKLHRSYRSTYAKTYLRCWSIGLPFMTKYWQFCRMLSDSSDVVSNNVQWAVRSRYVAVSTAVSRPIVAVSTADIALQPWRPRWVGGSDR